MTEKVSNFLEKYQEYAKKLVEFERGQYDGKEKTAEISVTSLNSLKGSGIKAEATKQESKNSDKRGDEGDIVPIR